MPKRKPPKRGTPRRETPKRERLPGERPKRETLKRLEGGGSGCGRTLAPPRPDGPDERRQGSVVLHVLDRGPTEREAHQRERKPN